MKCDSLTLSSEAEDAQAGPLALRSDANLDGRFPAVNNLGDGIAHHLMSVGVGLAVTVGAKKRHLLQFFRRRNVSARETVGEAKREVAPA